MEVLETRVPALTDVRETTLAASAPFALLMAAPDAQVSVAGPDGGREQHAVLRRRIGAGYFSALGIPIVSGRELETRDRPVLNDDGAQVADATREIPVVLNQTAAALLFPGRDAVDGRLRSEAPVLSAIQLAPPGATSSNALPGGQVFRVVGVARDVKSAFMNASAVPTVFWPVTYQSFAQGSALGTTIAIRGAPGADAVAAVRRELTLLFPDLTIFNVRTMDEQVNQFNTLLVWSSLINGGIGVFALILAAIGLAGVTTHAVSRRRKEIGIRIALGAPRPTGAAAGPTRKPGHDRDRRRARLPGGGGAGPCVLRLHRRAGADHGRGYG